MVFTQLFFRKQILVVRTKEGIRAVSKGEPIKPESVERYLQSKFGEALPEARAAMEQLAKSLPPKALISLKIFAQSQIGSCRKRFENRHSLSLLPEHQNGPLQSRLPRATCDWRGLHTQLKNAPNLRMCRKFKRKGS